MSLVVYSDSDSEESPNGAKESISLKSESDNPFIDDTKSEGSLIGSSSDNKMSLPEKPKVRLPPPPFGGRPGQSDTAQRNGEVVADQYGRIRSFPHVEGNYPGYVFIKASHAEGLEATALELFKSSRALLPPDRVLHAVPAEEMHVSLSRTFAVRRHQIEPLVALLTERLRAVPRFPAALRGGRIYSNDERTRTFAGLRVCAGQERMRRLIAATDAALRAYRQPPYYSEADVHVSVAWAAGPPPDPLPAALADGREAHLHVARVHAKIGARTYEFELP
jgi:2'-5' RNA ligase